MAKDRQTKAKKEKKTGYTKAELAFDRCKNWIGLGYAALILVIYPLCIETYYTLETFKPGVYLVFTLAALALLVLAGVQALLNGVRPRATSGKALWQSVSITQKLVALYFLLCVVSYFTSPYFGMGDLWGGTSRNEGLRTQLLYAAAFFITANCVKQYKDWLLLAFGAFALAFSGMGVFQHFGASFGPVASWGPPISFYSTIGNKNMVSTALCIILGILTVALVVWEDRRRRWLLPSYFVSMLFMLLIENDSGVVGLGALLLVLPILCGNTPVRISRGLLLYALAALAFSLWRMLPCSAGPGTPPVFAFGRLAGLGLGGAALLFALSWGIKKIGPRIIWSKKVWMIFWGGLVALLLLGVVIAIMSIELRPEHGFLYQFQDILRGNWNDSYGSGRIYVWKRTLALLPHTPVFGFGPDCFYLAFNEANYYESLSQLNVFFDFAHNEYLQTAVNYGLVGLGAYLAAMVSLAVRAVKRKEQSAFALMFAMGAFIYCVQAFFAFAHVMVTPLFWVALGLVETSVNAVDKGLE